LQDSLGFISRCQYGELVAWLEPGIAGWRDLLLSTTHHDDEGARRPMDVLDGALARPAVDLGTQDTKAW
jgi:hypothetical protein